MKGFDVLKIKSAVKTRNRLDLSAPVLATMEIGQIVPLGTWELVPGDDFNIKMNAFSRLAPLVEPTYGKVNFKTVCGFVPYHQVAYDADAWFAGKTSFEGQTPHQRWFTLYTLHQFVVNSCTTTSGATSSNCDYSYTNSSGTIVYCVFTTAGRYYIKVLNALGYALPQGVDLQTGSVWLTNLKDFKLSAFPFLAFFKLYNDYMSQSQRFNTSSVSDILLRIKNGNAYSGYWVNTSGELLEAVISTLFTFLLLNYDNDYFTTAWQTASLPLGSNEGLSGVDIPGQTGYTTFPADVKMSQNGGPLIQPGVSNNKTTINQRALDFLRSFDNWVRRNNYSGSRSVQQLYSRFGIKTDDYRTHYAHVIGTDSISVQIGDVTATAATSGASGTIPLGDYAGKGIMSGQIGCSYKSSDFGMLFVFGYYTVVPLNAYGFDRSVLRSSPLDYYNPEFDGLGAEAIPLMEYFESPRGVADADTTRSDSIFGFTERYNSYRFGRPKILGDWRKYDGSSTMNAWHTGRLLNAVRKAGNLVAQSSAVNTLSQVNSEYNRIFSVTGGYVDHFYLTCWFDVSAVRPMLNLNQVVDLGEGDTNVPRNGNTIS